MSNEDSDRISQITLQVNSLFRTFYQHVSTEDGVDVIADDISNFLSEITLNDGIIALVHTFSILKSVCDSLDMQLDDIEDYILNPISMKIISHGST